MQVTLSGDVTSLVVCSPVSWGFDCNSPMIRHNPTDGFQASLLIKLEKLDWGSILDNKSHGHAR